MVNLVTVPNRELMKVGSYELSTGPFEVTPKRIQDVIKAHEAGVLRKPVIRLGHNDPRFSGDPAVGWVDNVRASEDGTTLYGDLVGVPQWLAEHMPSAYPSLSIEGMYDYTAPDGTQHDFILTGVGLLGATAPGIGSLKSMQDLESLYSSDALVDIAAAAGVGGTAVSFTVQAAEPKPYGDVKYADPKNGKYPINTKEHVKAAWAYVNMPKNQKGYSAEELAQIKSRIKSAAKKFGIQIEAASAALKGESVMASLQEQLAQRLGLDADADEATVLQAFEEKFGAENTGEAPEPAAQEQQPEPVAASAPAPDVVNLQKEQYDVLMAAAAEVHKIRAEQAAEAREKLVMAAVKDGRITPASRGDWLKALEVDPGGHNQTALASLKPGFVPVSEIGHGLVSASGAEVPTTDGGDDQVAKYAEGRIFAALGIPTPKGN